MADIMIVLLIIFMVAVPLATSPGSVALPRADRATERKEGPVVLTLHADGTVLLERLPVPGGPSLRLALERRLRGIAPEDRQVVVEADEALPYTSVGAALTACREAGVNEIALASRTTP